MKKSHIIALVLIAVAIAAILSTLSDASTYASFSVAGENPQKTYHVVGKLNKEKPLEYNPQENANLFTFFLVDNDGKETKVVLEKSKPQDFEKSEQIVVIGKMEGSSFHASDVLMKCPSKYNNPKDDMHRMTNS
jgi:cytochrome c-type biogenesis protein CcmE